jgi:hypothetical protein
MLGMTFLSTNTETHRTAYSSTLELQIIVVFGVYMRPTIEYYCHFSL